ncbi:hypothetical protein UCD39_15710 [Nitrospirillum sp. BR 11752]|uniref:hypothetical protein n=1 Tax=Nitrospirillum sp. BR 11752 TaxID=3104293 RepID=UPI002ECEBCAF|nr:hypothetical protein [Nitrospirillum sp. BR 11752]
MVDAEDVESSSDMEVLHVADELNNICGLSSHAANIKARKDSLRNPELYRYSKLGIEDLSFRVSTEHAREMLIFYIKDATRSGEHDLARKLKEVFGIDAADLN